MEIHEAVRRAKASVADLFSEEGISHVGLEEVNFDEMHGIWNITVGFSRRGDPAKDMIAQLRGEVPTNRIYKVVRISDQDGRFLALQSRDIQ